MGMKYIAVSKDSGKKVIFKTKKAMDAALKANTHTTVKKDDTKTDTEPVKPKGKPVFGKGKKVFNKKPEKKPEVASGDGLSVWDSLYNKVVKFKTTADLKKAINKPEDMWRYSSTISQAKYSPVDVSSLIANGEKEAEFYDTLQRWSDSTDDDSAKGLFKMKSILDKGKNKMPKIFKPDVADGTPVYRGLANLNDNIKDWLKTTDKNDWKRVTDKRFKKDGGKDSEWYIYTGKKIGRAHV